MLCASTPNESVPCVAITEGEFALPVALDRSTRTLPALAIRLLFPDCDAPSVTTDPASNAVIDALAVSPATPPPPDTDCARMPCDSAPLV